MPPFRVVRELAIATAVLGSFGSPFLLYGLIRLIEWIGRPRD